MSKNFVPFSASATGVASAKTSSRTNVVADSKMAEAFRPITESRLSAHSTPADHEPKVTLERDGSRVTCIKIQCVCGHTIELTCE